MPLLVPTFPEFAAFLLPYHLFCVACLYWEVALDVVYLSIRFICLPQSQTLHTPNVFMPTALTLVLLWIYSILYSFTDISNEASGKREEKHICSVKINKLYFSKKSIPSYLPIFLEDLYYCRVCQVLIMNASKFIKSWHISRIKTKATKLITVLLCYLVHVYVIIYSCKEAKRNISIFGLHILLNMSQI